MTVIPKDIAAIPGVDGSAFRTLMRHHAAAVTVVAAGSGLGRHGLTATAVCSLSAEPPAVLACIQLKSGTYGAISETRAFSVNILASDQQEIAERFSGRRGVAGEQRFAGLDWTVLQTGAPILVNALTSLDCELIGQHRFTTHVTFIGRVVSGQTRNDVGPLLYFQGGYHMMNLD